MTADQLRRLAVLIERTDYEAIDRAAAYLRACADALDAEPVAWMYPDDYERMKTSETFCTVFSVKVVSPDRGSTTVQLYPLAMPAAPTPPVQQCRDDGRCQYAIDHGAEGMGHCLSAGECVMRAQQDDEALEALKLALDAMNCGDTGDDLEDSHRCGKCDEYVDRNAPVRQRIRALLEKRGAA